MAVWTSTDEVVARFVDRPDEESFAEVFRAMAPQLVVYFRARGCEAGVAEDLTQEVMLATFRKVGSLRIAKNELLQYVRQQGRRPEVTALPPELSAGAWNPFDGLRLGEWLDCLSPEDRELMLLRYVDGFACHEIAELLEIPMGTVQWRVFRLKKQLAEHFA